MKKTSAIYLVVSLLIWFQPASALESKKIYQLNENSIFQIRVLNRETGKKSSIGSGFIVNDGLHIATNFHVISKIILEPELFYITFKAKNGREGELKLIAMDVAHDLALLVSSEHLGKPIVTADLPPKGAPVYAMGNPLDLGLSLAVGTNGGILNQTDDSRIPATRSGSTATRPATAGPSRRPETSMVESICCRSSRMSWVTCWDWNTTTITT